MTRTLKVIYALDHFLLDLCTWGNCLPYEMISSALWSLEQDGKPLGKFLRPVIDWIMRDPMHCHEAEVTFLKITGALK